jgi:hypothetical protein
MATKKPVPKKKKPIAKKKPVKKSLSTEILEAIFEECNRNENIALLDYTRARAILIKKHVASVRRLRNTHITCMQPMEDFHERTFFHTFMITWIKTPGPISNRLIDMAFPIIKVQSAYGAIEAIQSQ